MAPSTSAMIWQALVAFIRASAVDSQLTGGIHKGTAPEKKPYPLAQGDLLPAPYEDTFGRDSRMIVCAVDLVVYSRNSVEADNVDAALAELLDGAALSVTGQDTLICQRVQDLNPGEDYDSEGKAVYGSGGQYEIWTDQKPNQP